MITYPHINPVAVHIGPLAVHWYGIMYLVGFGSAWWLGRRRARQAWRGWQPDDLDDLVFYVALGVILGGRIGYMLFYDLPTLVEHPLTLFMVWHGGMSFHGGLIGVLIAMGWYGRKRGKRFFEVADFIAPLIPPGLGAGRLGNFINGELWGKPTTLPWGMVFPDPRAGGVPRQPSQLYEFALEGVVLFCILWLYSRRPRPTMAVSGLFLACYGVFRFAVEFVRVPDPQLGYLAFGWVTMGQILSFPMIVAGVVLMVLAYKRAPRAATHDAGAVSGAASPGRKRV